MMWHRIRGHVIKHVVKEISYMDYSHGGFAGVEAAYQLHSKVCSCGQRWAWKQ